MPVKVILADDHKMIREGLALLLGFEPDIELVAHAANGEEAITLAQAWKPDVILMDICMPGTNGIDATMRIVKLLPRTRVIALSAHGERTFVAQMVEAIRAVMTGQLWLPDSLEAFGLPQKRLLSRRERAVLQELAAGKRAREVAEAMSISTKTVDTYRRRIMAKLGLASQAELVRYAVSLHASVS